jgi:EAL domain-containing protein (putative c-di-GMP-specific phosphodiesterase class I)
MTKTALLIGVSEYQTGFNALPGAIRDIEALKQILEDPEIGGFHQVKILANPDRQIMQGEIEALFTGADREDLVLLYFSGHGVKDETGNLYFATSITQKNNRNQLIKSTTVPASFVHEMMNICPARRQGIILDCCFSGAFDPNFSVKDDSSIDLKGQLGAEGRFVLASSSHIQSSLGQKEVDSLSVYTDCLVNGMRTGEADLDEDGEISIQDLHFYISSKIREISPTMNPKLIVLKDLGFDIVLAKSRVKVTKKKENSNQKIDIGTFKLPLTNNINRLDYLPNFLAPYEELIEELIEGLSNNPRLRRSFTASGLEEIIVDVIQEASKADFIFVFQSDSLGTLSATAQSTFTKSEDNKKLIESLSQLFSSISIESIFNPEHHGIHKRCVLNGEDTSKFFVFVPLDLISRTKFMVVAGLSERSKLLGDAYGKVISSFYHHGKSLSEQPALLEAAMIDDLKRDYKFLSLALYNRRFELFCDRLKKMTIYFEPILELDSLTISGWEALARDPETSIAPYDLFHAAELWGVRFMIELDQHFLKVAAEKYCEGRKEIKQNRPQDILPLSVNVYPESLTRTAYFKTVQSIVQADRLLPGRKLILEISEKISLPKYDSDIGPRAAWVGFKDQLLKYVRDLKVRFAIDDFGVEHASISQLAGLKPPYIKIDREILFHESRDIIINFVHDLGASNTLNPPDVIIEGFDEESPVSLKHLKEIGVNYIQGYIVSRAQPKIYRLSEEKSKELRELIASN